MCPGWWGRRLQYGAGAIKGSGLMGSNMRVSVGDALRRLNDAQKPGVGVPAYTRWVNRRLARYVAAVGHAWGWTPNMVSIVSFAVSAIGLGVLLLNPWGRLVTGIVVAFLLALGFVLDSADGQLARLSGKSSPAGEWLDHLLDAVRSPAVHLCILVLALRDASTVSLWLACVAFLFTLTQVGQFTSQMLGGMLLDRTAGPRTPARRHQSWILLPTDTGVMCWIFVLWGLVPVFVACYTLVWMICAAHALVSMRRRFSELSRTGSRV